MNSSRHLALQVSGHSTKRVHLLLSSAFKYSVICICRDDCVRVLHLNGNQPELFQQRINVAQLFAICEVLQGSELTFIDLSYNDATPANQRDDPEAATFGDECAASVARLVKSCPKIASVILKGNAIGPAGADEIAQALSGDSEYTPAPLQVLILAHNPIGDDVRPPCTHGLIQYAQ